MRISSIGLVALLLGGCSSAEVTTVTSSSGTAQKASASAERSAASPAPRGSAGPAGMRDAEAELKAIDPFNETAADIGLRVVSALSVCGEPKGSEGPWGGDDSVIFPPFRSRCSAATHAKLYMKSVVLKLAKDPASKVAEDDAYLALALDPNAALPEGASKEATAALAAAKKRRKSNARLRELTTTDDATKKELEASIATEILPTALFCFRAVLPSNINLQGGVVIEAELASDGRLSDVKVGGSLPDRNVVRCTGDFAARSKLAPPAKAPARIKISVDLSAGW